MLLRVQLRPQKLLQLKDNRFNLHITTPVHACFSSKERALSSSALPDKQLINQLFIAFSSATTTFGISFALQVKHTVIAVFQKLG